MTSIFVVASLGDYFKSYTTRIFLVYPTRHLYFIQLPLRTTNILHGFWQLDITNNKKYIDSTDSMKEIISG